VPTAGNVKLIKTIVMPTITRVSTKVGGRRFARTAAHTQTADAPARQPRTGSNTTKALQTTVTA
jgi:hypothetical protein